MKKLSNLTTLTFADGFNISEYTNSPFSFTNCTNLTEIDMSKTSITSLVPLSFSGLTNLQTLKLGNFKVKSLSFSGLTNLKTLTFGENFDTSAVTTMANMFQNCSSLQQLDLSKFDTSNVTKMTTMFDGCENLQSLDLSSFNFDSCTSYSSMFRNCGSVDCEIILPTNVSKAISLSGAGSWVQVINGEAQTDSIKVTLDKLEWNGSEKHIIKKIA